MKRVVKQKKATSKTNTKKNAPAFLVPIKKQKVISKPNTKKRPITKLVKEFFYDMYHLKRLPMPPAFFDRLSPQLIEWAETNPKADKLSKFFSSLGIHMMQVDRWCKTNDTFKAAVSQAKQLIGDRRHDMIIQNRDINPSLLFYTQGIYDGDKRDAQKTKAQLAAKLEQPPTEVTVIMPDLTKIEDKK